MSVMSVNKVFPVMLIALLNVRDSHAQLFFGAPVANRAVVDKGPDGCDGAKYNKCFNCEGDCDTDNDCHEGYKCFQRENQWTTVPGCARDGYVQTDGKDHDYCYDPNGAAAKIGQCPKTPFMPVRVRFVRRWRYLLNHVSLYDPFGNEFAYVQVSPFNWKDPFAFPGATLWWKGQGYGEIQADGLGQKASRSWLLMQDGDVKLAYTDTMATDAEFKVYDCNNELLSSVGAPNGNTLYTYSSGPEYPHKAGWYQTTTSKEVLSMELMNTQSERMMKYTVMAPCTPFAPMCQVLQQPYFLKGHWHSEVLMKDYNKSIAMAWSENLMFTDSGQSDVNGLFDLRTTALWGAYNFSQTRFSPAVGFFVGLLTLSCCFGCCYYSVNFARAKRNEYQAQQEEEQQKLIEDATTQAKLEHQGRTFWGCCTRRAGDMGTAIRSGDMNAMRSQFSSTASAPKE